MSESNNARRERIAAMIYAHLVTQVGNENSDPEDARIAFRMADNFIAFALFDEHLRRKDAPKPDDGQPTVLGMAKLILGMDWKHLFQQAWMDDHASGKTPAIVESVLDNLRAAIAREEAARG